MIHISDVIQCVYIYITIYTIVYYSNNNTNSIIIAIVKIVIVIYIYLYLYTQYVYERRLTGFNAQSWTDKELVIIDSAQVWVKSCKQSVIFQQRNQKDPKSALNRAKDTWNTYSLCEVSVPCSTPTKTKVHQNRFAVLNI